MTTDPAAPTRSLESDEQPTPGDRLQRVASALYAMGDTQNRGPILVGLVADTEQLDLVALDHADPIEELVGQTAPSDWEAAGVVTGARARLLDEPDRGTGHVTFVHLVDRAGLGLTLMGRTGEAPLRCGPDDQPMQGRAADACRRMLGLPTAPPPHDMTSFVVDAWLARVVDVALQAPPLSWSEVVDLHPGSPPRGATPGSVARITASFGTELDWDRFRRACAQGEPPPYVSLDADAAAWMDAGMFARCLLGEMPPWESTLDLLDGVLTAEVSDRLRAAVSMCPAPPWPPR